MAKYADLSHLPDSYNTVMCTVWCPLGMYFSVGLEKRLNDSALKHLEKAGVRVVGVLPSERGGGGGEEVNILATIMFNVKTLWEMGEYIRGLVMGYTMLASHIQYRMKQDLNKNIPQVTVTLQVRSSKKDVDQYDDLGERLLELEILAAYVIKHLQDEFPEYRYGRDVSVRLENLDYAITAYCPAQASDKYVTRLRRTLLIQKPRHNTTVEFCRGKLNLVSRKDVETDKRARSYYFYWSRKVVRDILQERDKTERHRSKRVAQ